MLTWQLRQKGFMDYRKRVRHLGLPASRQLNEHCGMDFVRGYVGERAAEIPKQGARYLSVSAYRVASVQPSREHPWTIEAVNGRLRDECLNEHWFLSLADAQAHYRTVADRLYPLPAPRGVSPIDPSQVAESFTHPTVSPRRYLNRG